VKLLNFYKTVGSPANGEPTSSQQVANGPGETGANGVGETVVQQPTVEPTDRPTLSCLNCLRRVLRFWFQ